jgi:excisionase family DNA binding protein
MDNQLLRIDEVAVILGISRSFTYQLASKGQLRAVRFGRSVRVRPEDLERFVSEKLEGTEQKENPHARP